MSYQVIDAAGRLIEFMDAQQRAVALDSEQRQKVLDAYAAFQTLFAAEGPLGVDPLWPGKARQRRQRTNVWRKGTRPARPQALFAYKRSCAFFETLMNAPVAELKARGLPGWVVNSTEAPRITNHLYLPPWQPRSNYLWPPRK